MCFKIAPVTSVHGDTLVTMHGKGDFEDVIKVTNQLTPNKVEIKIGLKEWEVGHQELLLY